MTKIQYVGNSDILGLMGKNIIQSFIILTPSFLQFNEKDILENAGKVTAIAKEFAESEFEKYRVSQDRLSFSVRF